MHETVDSGKPLISKTGLIWLTIILCTNVAIGGFVWSLPTDGAAPKTAESSELPGLKLLSELSESERASKEAALKSELDRITAAQEVLRREAADALECRIWGPFGERDAAEALRREVAEVGSALELRESDVAGEPDFLVYVNTGNNLDVARRYLQELESQALDAYVMAGGPYQYSVSVGVFSRERRAVRQRERVAALGYDVVLQPLSRSQRVYHLVARVPRSYSAELGRGASCAAIASVR